MPRCLQRIVIYRGRYYTVNTRTHVYKTHICVWACVCVYVKVFNSYTVPVFHNIYKYIKLYICNNYLYNTYIFNTTGNKIIENEHYMF